ncbi:RHS repeat domain-containing protein [Burkholderia ambifaria]|uniref:RHS repeat domain-containing protein n=1 Tax=Burkholderia ambifaria TaxID=152480 RepID=UPI001FC867E4|nr:RHS repeat-associated core domain-containing protein [Burkholderia ambifaria]
MCEDKRFEYDSYGQLVRKLSGHGPAKALVLEYDDWNRLKLGVTKARLSVGLARIDQRASAANDANARDAVYYFHNDLSGLPEERTDADGELVWQARYKVWGQRGAGGMDRARAAEVYASMAVDAGSDLDICSGASAADLRFQGQYLNRETGLHYNTVRFYDPDIGRFISPDPIGQLGGRIFINTR